MLFNSWTFVAFLAIVLPLYHFLGLRAQNVLLLVASYAFYSGWDWRFTGLLAASTLLDYAVARGIEAAPTPRGRRLLLWVSVCGNLGVLGYFKYAGFFVDSAAELLESLGFQPNLPTLQLLLPVGISFYTFQTMAYTIDVYRGEQRASRDFLTYALYVCYFPQLVAGPIERFGRLAPQLTAPRKVTVDMVTSGVQLILWGYVKKVAIADSLAPYIEQTFSDPGSAHAVQLWLGVYCFAFQIYGDFAGYTDIARGVSRLFGIELMLNFKQPYFSRNITEYWRRWHISFSTWLRDYVYISLGGNRRGSVRQYVNMFITMVLGGLWHGAAWNFVIWGAMNGVVLSVHRFFTRHRKIGAEPPPSSAREWVVYLVSTFCMFHIWCLMILWFRSPNFSNAIEYTQGMFLFGREFDVQALLATGMVHAVVLFGLMSTAIDAPCWYRDRELPFTEAHPLVIRALGYAAALFVLCFLREGPNSAFYYFQF